MAASIVTVPSSITEAQQKTWVENTGKYGVPIYLEPFWFWPTSLQSVDAGRCAFAGFKGADHVEACLVWNQHKEPCTFCLWNDKVPLFIEDRTVTSAAPSSPGAPSVPTYPGKNVEIEIGTAVIDKPFPWGWLAITAAAGGIAWHHYRKKKK